MSNKKPSEEQNILRTLQQKAQHPEEPKPVPILQEAMKARQEEQRAALHRKSIPEQLREKVAKGSKNKGSH